eukprot:s2176_g5.t1
MAVAFTFVAIFFRDFAAAAANVPRCNEILKFQVQSNIQSWLNGGSDVLPSGWNAAHSLKAIGAQEISSGPHDLSSIPQLQRL